MKKKMAQLLGFVLISFLMGSSSWAVDCDCSVVAFAPFTASHKLSLSTLRKFQLESYDNSSIASQRSCRISCAKTYEKEMKSETLTSLLLAYAQNLIENKSLGYNCTGLTTLRFPVRVKAKLGDQGLGHVADVVHVVNHEQICF
jgi:hypothetical protein